MKMNRADMRIRMYLFIDIVSLLHKRQDGVFIIGQRYNNSVKRRGGLMIKKSRRFQRDEFDSCLIGSYILTIRFVVA